MLEHASTVNKSDRAVIDSQMEWYVGLMGQSKSSSSDPLAGAELAAFVAAFEAGSVRGAADALCLTQSAVTKRILSIERRLGSRLFERGRFGVRPTAFGQALYPSAKQALGALDAVAQAAEDARQAGFSDLRLSASVYDRRVPTARVAIGVPPRAPRRQATARDHQLNRSTRSGPRAPLRDRVRGRTRPARRPRGARTRA